MANMMMMKMRSTSATMATMPFFTICCSRSTYTMIRWMILPAGRSSKKLNAR